MSTKVSSPNTPQAPSTAQSIQDWINAMPQIMQAQSQYAPQEAQLQLQMAQQYSLPIAQAYKQAQDQLYPELAQARDLMINQAMEGMQNGLTDNERTMYQDYFNANLGSNVGSPVGARDLAQSMVGLETQRQDYYRNLASSMLGGQPVYSAQSPMTSNYMSGFTPNSVMGYNASNYGSYADAYSKMYNSNANIRTSMNQMWGDIGSAVLGGAMGGTGTGMAKGGV